jgi:hypothetical protein
MVFIFAWLLCPFNMFAQKSMINEAIKALQVEDYDKAIESINQAIEHEETKNLASAWYYRGMIYKTIYSNKEKENKQSPAREKALESLVRFFELDTISELHESAVKSTRFMASNYYNDAAALLSEGKFDLAIENLELFKKYSLVIDPKANFKQTEMQFYLVLGQNYNQVYDKDKEANKEYFQKTKNAYSYVLELDSNNLSANYNLGILYYNEAVNIIKNLDYDLDIITLELIQEECVDLFSKSLPYMQRAYNLNPKRKETLIGLSGIYFSLNEMEKSEAIQEELKKLSGN